MRVLTDKTNKVGITRIILGVAMKKYKILIFALIWMCTSLVLVSYANSAEPPRIIVIVPNAEDDLEVYLDIDGERVDSFSISTLFEKQYKFYPYTMYDSSKDDEYTIIAKDSSKEVVFDIEMHGIMYNTFYTLDFENETIVEGKTLSRAIILVSLRVLLTLIIEGFIFYLFGYKKKWSWAMFLIINLITQGGINIYINSFMPIHGYYIISIFFAEIYVLAAELIAFNLFVREGLTIKKNIYVVIANIISFILGGYILMMLPV